LPHENDTAESQFAAISTKACSVISIVCGGAAGTAESVLFTAE
jgi:hypothetical protein